LSRFTKVFIILFLVTVFIMYLMFSGYITMPINVNRYFPITNKTTSFQETITEETTSFMITNSNITEEEASNENSTSFYNILIRFKDYDISNSRY